MSRSHLHTGLLILLIALTGRSSAKEPEAKEGRALFRDQVRALLTTKCLSCHGADKQRGGLDLRTRESTLTGGDSGPAFKPGAAKESPLFQLVARGKMPKSGPLAADQVELLRKWIDAGAPFEDEPLRPLRAGRDWWSLQPIKRTPVPSLHAPHSTLRTPIDAFILAKLAEKGLSPAPEADRRTLVRRVTFDLTGLPPTPEEIDRALADESEDWYEKVVDQLLASPAYGERWGRHWLDVVRFADSAGYEMNNPRFTAWPYRDHVIRSFNEDIPYPQRIREQLAADTLSGADLLAQAGTGFLVGGAHETVFTALPAEQAQRRMDDLDDMVSTTASAFLGLTVNCARCHDHKFDPIAQKDYYSLQAVFAGVLHGDREVRGPTRRLAPELTARVRRELAGLERLLDNTELPADPDATEARRPPVNPVANVERFRRAIEARFVRFTIYQTSDKTSPAIDEIEAYTAEEYPVNVALAMNGAKVTVSSTLSGNPFAKREHLIDGRHGTAHGWVSAERGQGTITIELSKPHRIDRILWGRDRRQNFRDRLAIDYQIEVASRPDQWKVVASSQDRRRYDPAAAPEPLIPPGLSEAEESRYRERVAQRASLLEQVEEGRLMVYSGIFKEPETPTFLLERGDPARPDEKLGPLAAAGLAAVNPPLRLPLDAPEAERRLALARWLGDPENPLTARVMVNRLWQWHFGEGLVSTPSDFGYSGSPPSHPELLDWLASEFVRQDWHMKPIHRLIVLSAAYRQSSRTDEKAMRVDRLNRLLWRRTPRRIEAESLRDSLLAVNGRLDRRMGGRGYYLWEPSTNYVTEYRPRKKLEPDDYRRMIYQHKTRSQHDSTFGVFDCPDASMVRPKRTISTTVLQALNLLNGTFTLDQAEAFAERLRRESPGDAAGQVERAFLLAFGRKPSQRESRASVGLVLEHGLEALCRALYNANEFVYVD